MRDLEEGFNIMNVFPSREELELIIKRYDSTNCRKLSKDDFKSMMLPIDANYSDLVLGRKPYN